MTDVSTENDDADAFHPIPMVMEISEDGTALTIQGFLAETRGTGTFRLPGERIDAWDGPQPGTGVWLRTMMGAADGTGPYTHILTPDVEDYED